MGVLGALRIHCFCFEPGVGTNASVPDLVILLAVDDSEHSENEKVDQYCQGENEYKVS